jgi:hypothetical protein
MNKKQTRAYLGLIIRRLCQMLMASGLAVLCVLPVQAAVATGDKFMSTFTETSGSNPGSSGTATLTVGTPASPGFFNVSNFSVTADSNLCLSCGLLNEDLSGVLFNAATFGVKGNITGTFQESGGKLHTFNLALAEPAGMWTLTDTRAFDGRTEISSGTYTPAVSAIPEPSVWVMLSLGLLALIYWTATERRTSIAAINRS